MSAPGASSWARLRDRHPVAILFVTMVVALSAAGSVALAVVGANASRWRAFPKLPWLDSWARWDAGWYRSIVVKGYRYRSHSQSSVAFFPAYPLCMALVAVVVGDAYLAGTVVTWAAGLAAVLLFARWSREHLPPDEARWALRAMLLYPFAFYLYGAVYAEALFLALALGAFMLLERDRTLPAALCAAAAAATRPQGLALGGALFVRFLELRLARQGAASEPSPAAAGGPPGLKQILRELFVVERYRFQDIVLVLLPPLGLLSYMAYLWVAFGDPLAFVAAQKAPGWGNPQGLATWLKVELYHTLWRWPWNHPEYWLAFHTLLTIIACLAIPAVKRRCGWSYTVYYLVLLGVPAITVKDFYSMGRYMLLTFPFFAAEGSWLARHPRARPLALTASGVLLFVAFASYATWRYVA